MTLGNEVRQPPAQRPNSACNTRNSRFSLTREGTSALSATGGNTGRALWERLESDEAPILPNLKAHETSREDDKELTDRPKTGGRIKLRPTGQANAFTALVERTVDALKKSNQSGAYEDAQRILADIRKQYDEVHAEAEQKEAELMDMRKEVRLVEVDKSESANDQTVSFSNLSRESITKRINDVNHQMEESQTTKRVLAHMVTRLKHEEQVVEQKIKTMEDHLDRKTREVQKRQHMSRRVHGDKVQSILELESMESDMEQERVVCNTALDDLELVLQQHRNEVRRREDFERWRYEVAMEAASDAFHAMAGRFRKIYAIEKLTGNCLQKIIFEQAEQSQATEDGFQKIREVTGLTDVMDIVHKFLNRDVEHEQLRVSVREAEAHLARLHGLREAEMNKHGEGIGHDTEGSSRHPRGLNSEVAEDEQRLHKAQRDLEEFQQRLRNTTLLSDNIMQWARKMSQSLSSFEELDDIETPQDLVGFFKSFKHTIARFFESANEQMTSSKLAKVTSHACSKQYAEQQKLLNDKDFIRVNCRVPASMDGSHNTGRHHHHHHGGHGHHGGRRNEAEEDRTDTDMAHERERLKQESLANALEKDQQNRANNPQIRRSTRDTRVRGEEEQGETRERARAEDSSSLGATSRSGPHSGRPSSRNGNISALPPHQNSRGGHPLASSGRPFSAGRPGSSRKK